MRVHEHYGVSLKGRYISAKNGEIRPRLDYQKKSISLNRPSQTAGAFHLCFARNQIDGTLQISFDIYNEKGCRLASVKHNKILRDQDHDGRYSVLETDDQLTVLENAEGSILFKALRRPKSKDSRGLVVSAQFYLPDGFLFEA